MALKHARGQANTAGACNGDSILKLLEKADLNGLSSSLKIYVAPVSSTLGPGKENDGKIELHKLAKEFVPFLAQFLKVCGTTLTSIPTSGDAAGHGRADELFSAMAIALDSLSQFRSFLTGCSFEIELQRYGLVRRLMAWKRFNAAFAQSQLLFRSLCQLNNASESRAAHMKQTTNRKSNRGGTARKTKASEALSSGDSEVLGPPQLVEGTAGLPSLTVSAVIDLIWCTAEGAIGSPSCFEDVARLPEQLASWISLLDAGNSIKQRDALFKALYKCTLVVVAQPRLHGAVLVQQLCKLTLDHCASSTQPDQYAKVARKFCSLLSSIGTNEARIAVEICSTALSNISSHDELQGIRKSFELLELVDWFSRSCQVTNQLGLGWCQVYNLVCQNEQVSAELPVAIAGLYGIGLLLMKLENEQSTRIKTESSQLNGANQNGYLLENALGDAGSLREAFFLLHCTKEVLVSIVHFFSSSILGNVTYTENSGKSSTLGKWTKPLVDLEGRGNEVRVNLFVSIARALHYLQKPSTRYAQIVWNEHISGSLRKASTPESNFSSDLVEVLRLSYPLVERGMSCSGLGGNDIDMLIKGFQMACQISVAALRFAMLHNSDIEEVVALVGGGIQHLQPEELWWFMSSTYNMGVQLFNNKEYSLACWPLELANKAAWARINSTVSTETAVTSLDELISEAYAKCSVLADARKRNGELGKSKSILIDGFSEWTKLCPLVPKLRAPHSLVKLFIKLVCLEEKPKDCKVDEGNACSLYHSLSALQPGLSSESLGLLLEEELVVCKTLRDQFPDKTWKLETDILDCLVDKVYTGDSLSLERAGALLERSRAARFRDSGNLPTCFKDASEALRVLEAAPEIGEKSAKTEIRHYRLKERMAVAYSMMAIYSYEIDPQSQDFYRFALLSSNTWKYLVNLDRDQGDLTEIQNAEIPAMQAEPLVLLVSLVDLLYIQGHSVLLIGIYELILKVAAYLRHPMSKDEWLCYVMNTHLNHLLCPIPFPHDILSNIRQSFDASAKPLEYWQDNMKIHPGSLMEAWHLASQKDCGCQRLLKKEKSMAIEEFDAAQTLKDMSHFNLQEGQKTSYLVLQSAGLRHILSELALEKGEVREAIKYAKEAQQLRMKLFKRMFRGFEKRSAESMDGDHPSSTNEVEILAQRDTSGSVAVSSWPFPTIVQQLLSSRSRWRILGDYVESLMQVGVVYEKMGAVDEAERAFREGHRIASAQNLPMAIGLFNSCLGEVHRKKHMWDSAENHFSRAKQTFDSLDSTGVCRSCLIAGKATLEMRIGDLVRHNWVHQQGLSWSLSAGALKLFSAETLTDAVYRYTLATETLSISSEGLDGITHEGDFRSPRSSDSKKEVLLSTLREHGKTISDKIMADVEGEPECKTAFKARKPRLRRSVHAKTSNVSPIRPGESHEETLDGLCEDLSLASLSADENPSKPQRRRTRSVVKAADDGLSNESAVQLVSDKVTDHTKIPRKNLKSKKDPLFNLQTEKEDSRNSMTQTAEGYPVNIQAIGSALKLVSIEERPLIVWNQHFRKLLARVLLQRGKCLIHLEELNEVAEALRKGVSTIFGRCLSCGCHDFSLAPLEEGAILYHMSRLSLYKRQLDECSRKKSSRRGSDSVEVHKLEIVDKLYRAFSLCHQVPPLLRKISKLLALLYVEVPHESPILRPGLASSAFEAVEIAAYFHQISLGTTMRQQHLAVLDSKLGETPLNPQSSLQSFSSECLQSMRQALRVLPVTMETIEGHVKAFLDSIPPLSACCVSFVDEQDVNLLRGTCFPTAESCPGATVWLLVTRFSKGSTPVVVLLPVAPLKAMDDFRSANAGESSSNPYYLTDDEEHSSSEEDCGEIQAMDYSQKRKQTILQKVAVEFESVLEESRRSTSGSHPVATTEDKSMWWKWRMQLDGRLEALIRKVEDSWLGTYKCLFLGEPKLAASTKSFELFGDHLLKLLLSITASKRQEGRMKTLNFTVVKYLLQGVGSFTNFQLERAIAEMLGWKDYCRCDLNAECQAGCSCRWKEAEISRYEQLQRVTQSFRAAFNYLYLSSKRTEVLGEESTERRRSRRQPKSQSGKKDKSVSDIISRMIREDLQIPDLPVRRQPIQLILDSDAQVFPWESLPILRDYEVYRMPSLGNVHAVYIQHEHDHPDDVQLVHKEGERNREMVERKATGVSKCASTNMTLDPSLEVTFINPFNTFYILNPSGDLRSTQTSFEDWFMQQPGWKGKAGTPPTAEEYKKGLQDFDLFVYLGHGSGDQFLPERFIRELDQCAATLLMGCSSGRLYPRGQYEPFGTVQSYLMGGCPSVIANLWDVTDGDIDRFSKFLLHKWMSLELESVGKHDFKQAISDLGECEQAMTQVSTADEIVETGSYRHAQIVSKVCFKVDTVETVRMSSAVGQSRNACRLPYLIGASPVCYGVPTGLRKQVH